VSSGTDICKVPILAHPNGGTRCLNRPSGNAPNAGAECVLQVPVLGARDREHSSQFEPVERYDLNLWIGDLFEGATYLPR